MSKFGSAQLWQRRTIILMGIPVICPILALNSVHAQDAPAHVTAQTIAYLPHEGLVRAKFSPDETMLLTWGSDNAVRVWDSLTGAELPVLPHEGAIHSAEWNSDGTQIVTATTETVRVLDSSTGELITVLHNSSPKTFSSADWNSDETRLITGGSEMQVWDASTGQLLYTLPEGFSSLGLNHDHTLTYGWMEDGSVPVWNFVTGEFEITLENACEPYDVRYTSWNENDTRLMINCTDSASVWDLLTGERSVSVVHANYISPRWNMDETRIVTTARGHDFVYVRDTTTGEILLTLPHKGFFVGTSWNVDETRLLTWSDYGTARIWNAITGEEELVIPHNVTLFEARWMNNGAEIFTRSGSNAYIWDSITGEKLLTLAQATDMTRSYWNSDESRLVTGSYDGAWLWEITWEQ
jgi:WD40 repeat protein